jgi:tetratricopeptide (TPR) repeat protein
LEDRLQNGAPVQAALAHACLGRAEALQGLRDLAGALDDLNEAVGLVEGFTEALVLRAEVRKAVGDRAGAERDLRLVIRFEPSDAHGWVLRAQARPGDRKSALADLDQALKIDRYCREALLEKARLLTQWPGHEQDALNVLNKLVFASDNAGPDLARRARHLAQLKERTAAHLDVDDFLENAPTPALHYEAACVFALTSRQVPADRERALQQLKLALRGGYGFQRLTRDPDLAALDQEPEFHQLVAAVRALGLAE